MGRIPDCQPGQRYGTDSYGPLSQRYRFLKDAGSVAASETLRFVILGPIALEET